MLALAWRARCGVPLADAARRARACPCRACDGVDALGARRSSTSYNANPGSSARPRLLAARGRGRSAVAVLGTMRELGAHATVHDVVARRAVDARST
jgi:UDP-N-acetylmuramyl pentapeptide synthase